MHRLTKKITYGLLLIVIVGFVVRLFLSTLTQESEGYRVVSYDEQTHKWTIIRAGRWDGTYMKKRLVVTCEWYQWGNQYPVEGPDQCDLQVGQLIVSNWIPKTEGEFVDIWEQKDSLTISRGAKEDRTQQHFHIEKYDVIESRPSRK